MLFPHVAGKMRRSQAVFFLLLAGSSQLCSAVDPDSEYSRWESSASWQMQPSAIAQLRELWSNSTKDIRDRHIQTYLGALLKSARSKVHERAPASAAEVLREVALVARQSGRILGRGKSLHHFETAASIHASVWSASGSDPWSDAPLGYQLQRDGRGFVALQENLPVRSDTTDDGTILPDLRENETAGLLLRINSAGKLLSSTPISLKVGKDPGAPLSARLTAIYESRKAGPNRPPGYHRRDVVPVLRD